MSNPSGQYLVTAAIDFGTTYSGYAYAHHAEEKGVIHVNSNWKSGSQSFKVPTAILFDSREKFLAFGFTAEDLYSGYADSAQEQDYFLFHRFKMALYNEKDVSRNLMLSSANGKKMKAIQVFGEAIKYLKEHLLESINVMKYGQQVTGNNVKWVLTVPAIWSSSARQFMVEAAEKAGIRKQDLMIALEPECASVYCKSLPIDKLPENVVVNKIGDKYMVVDIGGGTVDITIHELVSGKNIKELHKATGNDAGGTRVDKEFENYLGDMFTRLVIEHVREKNPSEWLEIERDFETIKRSAGNATKGETVIFLLKPCLHETYEAFNEITLVEAFKKGNIYHEKAVLQGKNRVKLPVEDFKNMIIKVTKQIREKVVDLLENRNIPAIDYVILVGGFSNSPVVLDEIRKVCQKIPVIRPPEAELAVVKGAVLYGLEPSVIKVRKAQRTYGIGISLNFKSDDPETLAFVDDQGVKKCSGCFQYLITVNESINVGESKSRSYFPFYSTDKSMDIKLYSTPREKVRYTNEPDVNLVATITVKMPNLTGGANREVKVDFHFGETTLRVDATDVTSGVSAIKTCDFLTSKA